MHLFQTISLKNPKTKFDSEGNIKTGLLKTNSCVLSKVARAFF